MLRKAKSLDRAKPLSYIFQKLSSVDTKHSIIFCNIICSNIFKLQNIRKLIKAHVARMPGMWTAKFSELPEPDVVSLRRTLQEDVQAVVTCQKWPFGMPGEGRSQQCALGMPGGGRSQQCALLMPGGSRSQQCALLVPGGRRSQQCALLMPGGGRSQQCALLMPGGGRRGGGETCQVRELGPLS